MTKKLFNSILTICLLFSSLYLPVFAETGNAIPAKTTESIIKKSPQAHFLDGEACLKISNIACVSVSLALIPKTSPYAKILEGALAFKQNQTDRALLLLLPIQADEQLIIPARILLHQTLAEAFESLGDNQQALQHLISTEALLSKNLTADVSEKIEANHQHIWRILKSLNQADLVTLRGNNTDNIFQGWIDLAIANNSADNSGISNWSALYTDHPALDFATRLTKNTDSAQLTQTKLAHSGTIGLMLPVEAEVDAQKLDAFKLGLETALNLSAMPNPIEVYYQQATDQDQTSRITQLSTEGVDYLIVPDLNDSDTNSHHQQIAAKQTLHLSLSFNDEANAMFKFANKNAMQHITVVTTEHVTSQKMLASIQRAWPQTANAAGDGGINTIVLSEDFLSQPVKLLDLRSQIAANIHDMVILAMPANDVVKIRPYLDISTPTMTFSTIHDAAYESDNLKLLNALRFVDMPFLLESDQATSDYHRTAQSLSNKSLLRWFALGADSLQLLIASDAKPNNTLTIKGLAGEYSISESGTIHRTLPSARFNQAGAIVD